LTFGGVLAYADQFLQAPQYPTGKNPQAVAAGDFNEDGKPDLAVANSGGNSVSILLGNGDGTFTTGASLTTGTNPQGVAVADFNGDGHLDLAVTNFGSNSISVYFGKGDGTFSAAANFTTGTTPHGVAAADFNGDGHADIAVTNAGDGNLEVFLWQSNGTADGTFVAQSHLNSTGFNPWSVTVADFNNDGKPDLAVANNNNNNVVSVLLGNGDGTFQNEFQNNTGNTPVWVVAADVNGDGYQDLVVADQAGNTVSVLLGKGNGGFAAHVEYPTAAFPTAVAIADLNGDGFPDLAVSAGNGNTVSILWGNGDGTFQTPENPNPENIGTGDIPYSVIAGDFNNDGNIDLIVANSGANTVSVVLNTGNKTFESRIDYPAGIEPFSVATADFNGDGFQDLVVADSNCPVFPNCGPGTISIMLGNGDGTFKPPVPYSTGTDTDPYSVVVGDFNGDHIPDVAVTNYATNNVSVFLGVGDGTFELNGSNFTVGREPASVATGDFNGDGNLDLAVANFHDNTISILFGDGHGSFKEPATVYNVGNGPVSVAAADFNGDKKLDLVVVNETDNDAGILLGNGDGTFQAQVTYPTGAGGNPLSVVVGDFSGNNILDLAVADFRSQQVSILMGNGDGTFQPIKAYPTGANPSSIVMGDFNGDGKLDLALTSTPLGSAPGNVVSLLLGNGDGSFHAPALFGAGSLAYSAAVGDFNGDGTADLAVANGASNSVSILLNTQGEHIGLTSSLNPSMQGESVTFTTTVEASLPGLPAPTGTITLKSGNTVLGSGTLANGTVKVSTASLPTGSSTVMAIYSGDSNFRSGASSPMNQTVQKASSSTTIASSSTAGNLILTATVSPSTSGVPTGTVSFLDGTTQLASLPLNSSGIAAFSTTSLAAGSHHITASYSGDVNFDASASSVAPITSSFTLAASALSPASITAGKSTTSTITISPTNGFNASGVAFACAITPAVSPAPSCSFGAISLSNGTGTAKLTVSTSESSAALADALPNHRSGTLLAFSLLIPVMLLGTGGLNRQHRRKLFACFVGALIIGGCLFQAGCGGSGGNSTPTNNGGGSGTPAGTYTITVTGSSNGVQNTAPSLTFSVQ